MGTKEQIRFTLALLDGRKVQLAPGNHEKKACRVSIVVTRGTLRFVSINYFTAAKVVNLRYK